VVTTAVPTIRPLVAPVRDYAWGSRTAIAHLQDRPAPTGRPEAEAWFGAHPGAPSTTGDTRRALTDVIADDPTGTLGDEVARRFDGRLPFLVKLLAADAPLSLQAHPDAAQAAAGFAAEEAGGIARDAPHRLYRDSWPKPELLHALTPFTALCGFRGPPRTARFIEALDVPRLSALAHRLATDDQLALAPAIEWALRSGRDEAAAALPDLRAAAARMCDRLAGAGGTPSTDGHHAPEGWWGLAARWLVELVDRYPDDPGTIVALLLRVIELQPGEAIHLPAGNLHAYLAGVGVEVMASSDNVLRGGLTAKHVDVDALLEVVDARFLPVPFAPFDQLDGEVVHVTPTPHFRLAHRNLGPEPVVLPRRGPEILLAIGGSAQVTADGATVALGPGQGAFVPASTTVVTACGDARLFRTTPGDPD
jgi:mannose-6-phosphate isomerase